MIKEAFDELVTCNHEELKFTEVLGKHLHEYKGSPKVAKLGKLLNKEKGEMVYCYETYEDVYVKSKRSYRRKKSYSIEPENLNFDEYRKLLLDKLKDSLEITKFDVMTLEHKLEHMTIPLPLVAKGQTKLLSEEVSSK